MVPSKLQQNSHHSTTEYMVIPLTKALRGSASIAKSKTETKEPKSGQRAESVAFVYEKPHK